MEYTITKNPAFNSLEITFTDKPSEAVRDALKGLRFRWHHVKGIWYGYADEDAVKAALSAADASPVQNTAPTATQVPKAPAAPVNAFGVKVGDLFHSSWGYDQTNNDYFQVVALVGKSSVRVREVYPVCEKAEPTGPMAEDRTVCTNTHGKLLPPASYSVFIKDQEHGDLKRLKSYAKDGKSDPCFTLDSFASAYLCTSDITTVYESWYA